MQICKKTHQCFMFHHGLFTIPHPGLWFNFVTILDSPRSILVSKRKATTFTAHFLCSSRLSFKLQQSPPTQQLQS